MASMAGLNIDALLATVIPYMIPTLIILLVLGAIFFVLRNLKWIIILGILAILLMYFGVIPKVNIAFFEGANNTSSQNSAINITVVKIAGTLHSPSVRSPSSL